MVRQVVVISVVAILMVAMAGFLARGATELVLSRVLTGYFGDEEGFDLLVQLQVEDAPAGREALEGVLQGELRGTKIRVGPSLGGQQNYFLALPARAKNERELTRLDSILARVGGYSGYTVLMHPVLTVNRVHPAYRDELLSYVRRQSGVRVAFWHGDDLVLLLTRPEAAAPVKVALDRFLAPRQVFQAELPYPVAPDLHAQLEKEIGAQLGLLPLRDEGKGGTSTAPGDRSGAGLPGAGGLPGATLPGESAGELTAALRSARRLLGRYVTRAEIPVTAAEAGKALAPGDRLLIVPVPAGLSSSSPGAFETSDFSGPSDSDRGGRKSAVVAQIVNQAGARAEAVVVRGQWNGGETARAFRWENGRSTGEVGTVRVDSPRLRLARSLGEVERVLSNWRGNGTDGASPGAGVDQNLTSTLDDLDNALSGVEGLLDRVQLLFAQSSGAKKDQLLLDLALRVLAQQLGVQTEPSPRGAPEPGTGGVSGLDRESVARLRRGIERLRAQASFVNGPEIAAVLGDLGRVRRSLLEINDGEIGTAAIALDRYLGWAGRASPVARLTWQGPSGIEPSTVKAALERALHRRGVLVTAIPAGIVQPDARTQLLSVIRSAGRLVGVLVAGFVTLLFLLLDQATLIAMWKAVTRAKARTGIPARVPGIAGRFLTACRRPAMLAVPQALYGAAAGALLWAGGSWAATAGRFGWSFGEGPGQSLGPGPGLWPAVIGAALGLVAALAAERLSPIPEEQVMAGESLGLSYRQILETIVIPAGRPGLWLFLLSLRRRLRGGRLGDWVACGQDRRQGRGSGQRKGNERGEAWQGSW